MKLKPLALLAGAVAAGVVFAEPQRVRTLVNPVRAWGSIDAATLTTPKFGQVAEGEFLVGSGTVLLFER